MPIRCFILVLIGAALALPLLGQENTGSPMFRSPAREVLARNASLADSGGDGYALSLSEDEYTFRADGSVTRRRYTEGMIFTQEAAEDWGDTQVYWEPWHEDRPELRARVVDASGKDYYLDPATIAEAAANENVSTDGIYNDLMLLRGPLAGISAGVVRITESLVRERTPVFPGGTVHFAYFLKGAPNKLHRLIVNYPATLQVSLKPYALDGITTTREETDGMVRVVMERRDLDPRKEYLRDDYLPPDVVRSPRVAVSTGGSWSDLAQRYHAAVEERVKLALEKDVIPVPPNLSSAEREKVQAVTRRLHELVRYTGVEFGEAALIPQPPEVVLERTFGDCKDKSVLLIAMLRKLGIPAYFTLIKSGGDDDVDPDVVGMGNFDHAIVVAELQRGERVWIDATAELLAPGTLPAKLQGRRALICKPDVTGLQEAPQDEPEANLLSETREYFLPEEGKARLVETTLAHGQSGWSYREWFSDWNEEEQTKQLNGYIRNTYSTGEVTKIERTAPYRLEEPAQLRIEAKEVQRGIADQKEAAVAVIASGLLQRLPEILRQEESEEQKNGDEPSLSKRTHDLLLPYPFVTEHRFRIHPAPGFVLRGLPANEERPLGPMTLAARYQLEPDGTVTAVVRFSTVKRRFTAEEARQINQNIREVEKRPATLVYFDQKGELLLAKGDVRGALDEFQKLPALGANPGTSKRRMARALLAAGAGESAWKVAEQAVALEPESAKAYWLLGTALQHDKVGRLRGKGYNPEAVLTALRKAHQLDPDDATIAAELAIQLEFNADGERYSDLEKLREAAPIYRKLVDSSKQLNLFNNLMHCYFRLGQYQEMLALLDTKAVNSTTIGFRAAALLMEQNPDAAITAVRAASLNDAERAAALQLAANLAVQVREYPKFVALIRAAAQHQPSQQQQYLAQANLYSLVTRWELPEDPSKDPVTYTQWYSAAMAASRITSEEALRAVRPPLLESNLSEEDRRSVENTLTAQIEPLLKQGIPRAVAIDVGMALANWTAEGDDQTGYRVTMKMPSGQSMNVQTLFVRRTDEGFRLAGIEAWAMGALALEHLIAGRETNARTVLRWAEEDLKGLPTPAGATKAPFLRLYNPDAEPGELRVAAASLMITPEYEAVAAPVLREALQSTTDPEREKAIRIALSALYSVAKKYRESAEVAEPLLESELTLQALVLYCVGRYASGDGEFCIRTAEPLIDHFGDRESVYSLLHAAAGAMGDFERGYEYAMRAASGRDGGLVAANSAAWATLYTGKHREEALDMMRKQLLTAPQASVAGSVHTLLCLEAELGHTTEARRHAEQVMEIWGLGEPNASMWLGYGLIYQSYGLYDEAIRAFDRAIEAEKDRSPLSSGELARRKREALQNAAAKPPA